MVRLLINNRFFFVKKKISILEACKFVGIKIPRFCFHENLSIAGNCRMCLVETDKAPKPIAACAVPIFENLSIITKGPRVLKSRENILEVLLLNHPLDCVICDQGGECDLQDQAQKFGTKLSRAYVNKRGVEDKYCGALIKTIMTRCIHCTRCIRFGVEICGTFSLGTLNRGVNTEIGYYISKISNSPVLSNIVDLCPVGALTLKTSSFLARPWELKSLESVDLTDGSGNNIYINYKELDVVKISPKKNKELNESWISDRGRFVFDSLLNHRVEVKTILSYKIFKKVLSFLNNKSNLFLINEELSFEEFNLLKKLNFLSKNKLKVKIFSNSKKKSNYYLWGFNSKILKITNSNSRVCLFLSSNIDVEASLLNIRLRTKFLIDKINFYAFGNFMSSTYSILFLRFCVLGVVSLFGSKNKIISKLLLKTVNPIIISGKSLVDRVNFNSFDFFLKKNSSFLNYTIHTKSNTESITYLNFNSYSNKDIESVKNIHFLNLDDSLNLRGLAINSNKECINFASHNSKLMEYTLSTISVLVPQETGGLYLNFEKRPQHVMPLAIKKVWGVISFKYFFTALIEIISKELDFPVNFIQNRGNLESVFNEIILNSKLFKPAQSLVNLIDNTKSFSLVNFKYNSYPFKLIIEDYLRINSFTKYSNVLLNRSREIRKLENTFKF
jgi:NADH dehydrogenase/NADH:ubiquinone oxidoreductase subunit G